MCPVDVSSLPQPLQPERYVYSFFIHAATSSSFPAYEIEEDFLPAVLYIHTWADLHKYTYNSGRLSLFHFFFPREEEGGNAAYIQTEVIHTYT